MSETSNTEEPIKVVRVGDEVIWNNKGLSIGSISEAIRKAIFHDLKSNFGLTKEEAQHAANLDDKDLS